MKQTNHRWDLRSGALARRSGVLAGLVALAGCISSVGAAPLPSYEWDIELTSMDLNVQNALLPLGPGWTSILTDIHIGESVANASKGKAYAKAASSSPDAGNVFPPDTYIVSSFFDVFFDISVKDVDPSANFGGGPIDGLTMTFPDNGPAHMQNRYIAQYVESAPNFGLIPPPQAAPYIGHFTVEIPLGADLNGNGENDKIKFTLVAHTVADENRTFVVLPDGTVVDSFDSAADLSGAVVDESQDPPFGPITLNGPTTATSHLLGVPDGGSTVWLVGASLGILGWMTRARRR